MYTLVERRGEVVGQQQKKKEEEGLERIGRVTLSENDLPSP